MFDVLMQVNYDDFVQVRRCLYNLAPLYEAGLWGNETALALYLDLQGALKAAPLTAIQQEVVELVFRQHMSTLQAANCLQRDSATVLQHVDAVARYVWKELRSWPIEVGGDGTG